MGYIDAASGRPRGASLAGMSNVALPYMPNPGIERLARSLHQREINMVSVAGLQTIGVAQQRDVGRLSQCAPR